MLEPFEVPILVKHATHNLCLHWVMSKETLGLKLQYGRVRRNTLGWTRVPWVSSSFLFFCGFFRVSSRVHGQGTHLGLIFLEINEFPFWLCCPAGGLDLGKSRFFENQRIFFSTMLPGGRPRSWKIAIFLEISEFPFRLCCPAGGLDLGKSLFLLEILEFPFRLCCPAGGLDPGKSLFLLEINKFPFRLCCPAGGLDPGKSLFLLEINEFPFRLCCPMDGLNLGKLLFFGNQRISFSTMLPCGRPRPWKIVIFWK